MEEIFIGNYWCQAVDTYRTKTDEWNSAVLTWSAEPSPEGNYFAQSHSMTLKSPNISTEMIGKKYKVVLIEA